MRRIKYIVTISVISVVLVWVMSGCSGCAKQPVVSNISPSSGPETGETSVTITGEKFKEGATVSIGGTPASSVNVVSKTEISAVTPAGTVGAANVVVKNLKVEEPGVLSGGFTYKDATPPTVTISPADGSSPDYEDTVNTGVTITATFNEAITQGSVSITVAMETLPDALVQKSGDIPGTVSYDSDTVARFVSDAPLKAARKYTVTVSGGKDSEGNPMTSTSATFSLKTPERVRWYTVKPGDTCENIADRPETYDDAEKWPAIVKAQQDYGDYIFNRKLIRPGQKLLIK